MKIGKTVLMSVLAVPIFFLSLIGLGTIVGPNELSLPPCEYEDSNNCYWDNLNRGNGIGDSFVRYNGVTIYYRNE